jgi:hypothetical protein
MSDPPAAPERLPARRPHNDGGYRLEFSDEAREIRDGEQRFCRRVGGGKGACDGDAAVAMS